jgi:hypothetical protein
MGWETPRIPSRWPQKCSGPRTIAANLRCLKFNLSGCQLTNCEFEKIALLLNEGPESWTDIQNILNIARRIVVKP